jgi:2-amino-4-hydroxy-6-hydroxymethyldihydropteridine diphosphokinase
MSARAFIALGANLADSVADRAATLHAAVKAIGHIANTRLVAVSPFYVSQPVDAQGPDFVNAVAEVSTDLSPQDLLLALHHIEDEFGRLRPYRNAPRSLDLDLLMVDQHVINTTTLSLPHPRLHQRAFVLLPLLDLAPDLVHPTQGRLFEHLQSVADQQIFKMT